MVVLNQVAGVALWLGLSHIPLEGVVAWHLSVNGVVDRLVSAEDSWDVVVVELMSLEYNVVLDAITISIVDSVGSKLPAGLEEVAFADLLKVFWALNRVNDRLELGLKVALVTAVIRPLPPGILSDGHEARVLIILLGKARTRGLLFRLLNSAKLRSFLSERNPLEFVSWDRVVLLVSFTLGEIFVLKLNIGSLLFSLLSGNVSLSFGHGSSDWFGSARRQVRIGSAKSKLLRMPSRLWEVLTSPVTRHLSALSVVEVITISKDWFLESSILRIGVVLVLLWTSDLNESTVLKQISVVSSWNWMVFLQMVAGKLSIPGVVDVFDVTINCWFVELI